MPYNTEKVPTIPSETVERKLLYEFLLLLLTLVAMGKTYPPEQQNSMAVKDKTGAIQHQKVPNLPAETVEKKRVA